MKNFILFLGLTFFSLAARSLEDGNYECVNGNEASICPQIVRTIVKENQLQGLRIYYSGYCGDQGPFHYDCENNVCGDGTILFTEIKSTSYRWENIPYGFFCEFKKSN